METGSREAKARRARRTKAGSEGAVAPSRRTSRSSVVSEDLDEKVVLANVRRTNRQKPRSVLDDDWQDNGPVSGRLRTSATCPVSKYSIVASRGELTRNGYSLSRDSLAPSVLAKKSAASSSVVRPRRSVTEENSLRPCAVTTSKTTAARDLDEESRSLSRARKIKSTARTGIPKSASVPVNLKEGLPAREKTRVAEEGILKKSSAFLASLAHSAGRFSERKASQSSIDSRSSCANGYRAPDTGSAATSAKYSILKGYFSILRSATGADSGRDLVTNLGRSSSVQTLPTGWKKKGSVGVKKSVSFSSDTSFEEKRAPYRRTSVHEAKVYRKGVLQDRASSAERKGAKVPPSWESPAEGRSALLRAARDGDDSVLNEIVTRVRKLGIGDMDVNMTDSSGRTAISYMAGNGAAAMLELALSFDGVDPNIPDNEGNTPLHFAAQAGQTECLNILLQRCPDIEVDARNSSGFTPLMKAALQGRTKCAKILLFAGANPTLKDHGRGLRAEQWARFCGRYVCAEVIERFARHRLLERTTSCRWGSEPELAAKVLQGKVTPIPPSPLVPPSTGLKSKIRKVFRTTSGPDRNFSLITQLTSAALCASSPALPKSSDVPPVVKSLLRPLSVPQLRVTLVSPQDFREKTAEKYAAK